MSMNTFLVMALGLCALEAIARTVTMRLVAAARCSAGLH
jgi:hypothetical protein